MSTPQHNRREFLRRAALATGATLLTPAAVLADPYHPFRFGPTTGREIRVRGRVTVDGRPRARVAVSDGLSVVTTGNDGRYELYTSDRRPFVFVSVPAGCAIPVHATGTARTFYPVISGPNGRMTADFALSALEQSDERHAFLALGDTQTQNAFEMGRLHDESVPDLVSTVAALGSVPLFGVAVGDIMFDDLSLYPEYERAVSRVGIPFFQVVGNHDLDFQSPDDPGSVTTFQGRFGPTWYSFDRGSVHYVVLDDVFYYSGGYIGHLDADQLAWLAQDLALVEAGRTVVVFQHIPGLSNDFRRNREARPEPSVSLTNRQALYRLLEPFDAHLITGHTHEHEHVFEGGVHEHILGTTCGAWWSDDICHDGTPNGYAVFEFDGTRLKWRYKGTGLTESTRLRVYARGAEALAPDEIVANVWDWDPSCLVTWYEDGVRRGPMSRRTGRDPMAVLRFTGPQKPDRRTWVEPSLVDHLFYAPVAEHAGDVVVEFTDRFGGTWTARPQPVT